MNILFYVEPRVDFDDPYLRQSWVEFCVYIIKSLNYDEGAIQSKVRILTNHFLANTDMLDTLSSNSKIVLCKNKFAHMFAGNPGTHRKASSLNDGRYDDYIRQYAELLKQTVKNFSPDIIITFLPEPALKFAFPDIPILHHETGAFYVAPFPLVFRLDPCGLTTDAWPYECKDALSALPVTQRSIKFMETFRNKCLDMLLTDKNPYIKTVQKIRKKYSKIWLLPLGVPETQYQFPMPDCLINNMTQYDIVLWTLQQMPLDHAVIITEHPIIPFLNKPKVDSIKKAFPQAIFLKESFLLASASQPLVPLVDGVITVASGIGYQATLFHKKLICLSPRSFLSALADSNDVNDADRLLSEPFNKQNDAIFHHLLTHYFVPEKIFRSTLFIRTFLNKTIKNFKQNKMGFDFYDAFASDDEALQIICSSIKPFNYKQSSIVSNVNFTQVMIQNREAYIMKSISENEGV